MATFTYTTSSAEDAVLALAAQRGGVTTAVFTQQFIKDALVQLKGRLQAATKEAAIREFKLALDAGQDLRVTVNATTGAVTTARVPK